MKFYVYVMVVYARRNAPEKFTVVELAEGR